MAHKDRGVGSISAECECKYNFTCGYCCRSAKPWFWTPTKTMHFYPCKKEINNVS